MDALSGVFTWLSEHAAGISAVVGITVLAGVLFAGIRSLLLRHSEIGGDRIRVWVAALRKAGLEE